MQPLSLLCQLTLPGKISLCLHFSTKSETETKTEWLWRFFSMGSFHNHLKVQSLIDRMSNTDALIESLEHHFEKCIVAEKTVWFQNMWAALVNTVTKSSGSWCLLLLDFFPPFSNAWVNYICSTCSNFTFSVNIVREPSFKIWQHLTITISNHLVMYCNITCVTNYFIIAKLCCVPSLVILNRSESIKLDDLSCFSKCCQRNCWDFWHRRTAFYARGSF